jgi:hypothetical protein
MTRSHDAGFGAMKPGRVKVRQEKCSLSRLLLEDMGVSELYLGRAQSRNFSFNQGQQLLAARVVADLQEERTVPFHLEELPPNEELLKHRSFS